jgi:hypothetical protein
MPFGPAAESNPLSLTPLVCNTYVVPLPRRQRSANLRRYVPPTTPAPLEPLPTLPHYIPSSPSFSPSVESFSTSNLDYMYPPSQSITSQPSTQSLSSQSFSVISSQNLLGRHPNTDERRSRIVYKVEAVNCEKIWIGTKVTVTGSSDRTTCEEFYEGTIKQLCERRKSVVCFVFKEKTMKRLYLVEVRNEMIQWPTRYKVLHYLEFLWARLLGRRSGHKLPI